MGQCGVRPPPAGKSVEVFYSRLSTLFCFFVSDLPHTMPNSNENLGWEVEDVEVFVEAAG